MTGRRQGRRSAGCPGSEAAQQGAALKLLRKLPKYQGVIPEAVLTDGLASNRAALRDLARDPCQNLMAVQWVANETMQPANQPPGYHRIDCRDTTISSTIRPSFPAKSTGHEKALLRVSNTGCCELEGQLAPTQSVRGVRQPSRKDLKGLASHMLVILRGQSGSEPGAKLYVGCQDSAHTSGCG